MSSPDLFSESDILITFNIDKAVECVVRWLQNSSIAQYFEDHPDARDSIVAAVPRVPRPETLSTPALTPCYTNVSDQQAPTPLTFQRDMQQPELTNDRDADSSEAERTTCDSQCSTDHDISSPPDRNNEIYNQDTNKGDQLLKQNVTLHQTGTRSPHLKSRRSKRKRIEDADDTDAELESGNSQHSARLEIQPKPDKSSVSSIRQLEGSDIRQDHQASKPTVASSTRQRRVAKLPRRPSKNQSSKAMDHPHNKQSDRFTELDLDLRLKIQKIADVETLKWTWKYLSIMRNPTLHVINNANEDICRQRESFDTAETSDQRLRELRDHIIRDEETKKAHKILSRKSLVSERLHLAELTGRYLKENDSWKATPRKRRKANEIRSSPTDRFVDVFFPETMMYKGKHISQENKKKREAAKDKFWRWIRAGEPWARMAQRFGYAILLPLPDELSNEDLRRLLRPHIPLFLDYIDFIRPGLKDQLSNLSIILPDIVYNRILPPQRLVLETLPESRLSEVGNRPLEELLQFCTEDQNAIEPAQEVLQNCIKGQDAFEPAQGTVRDCLPEDQDTMEPAQGIVPDCPPEDPDQLSSPIDRMDGGTPWAGDCKLRLNTAAIETKNHMTLNYKEGFYPSQASRLDNMYLLSPAIDFEEFLP